MSEAAAHVDKQYILFSERRALNQLFLDWIEARVHPARTALGINTHVVVEASSRDRFLLKVAKEAHVRLVSELECRVCCAGRVAIVGLLEEGGQGEDAQGKA